MKMSVVREDIIVNAVMKLGVTYEEALAMLEDASEKGHFKKIVSAGKTMGWQVPHFETRDEIEAFAANENSEIIAIPASMNNSTDKPGE